MRILIVSQYFWPENFIINDIARVLVEQGQDVSVATGKPNYPDGAIFEGYSASGFGNEQYLGNIQVIRTPMFPRGRGGAGNLVLNYLSFVFSGLLFFPWLFRRQKFDAILVFAPSPVLQAIPAILLSWLKGAKLVLWVQDLWPESLAATGYVRSWLLLRTVGWLVKGIYRCCDLLLVQSRAFIAPVARYAEGNKIIYFPNSVDVGKVISTNECPPESLLSALGQYFCVVFAGNLGTAQALDTLVETAQLLRDDDKVRLVLIGSGSRLAWLQSEKCRLKLDNLLLPGRFPAGAMPAIFSHAGALLVSLSGEEIFQLTVPSKLQAYLAAGRPIIASLSGEGATVVLESCSGMVSPACEAKPLAENVRRMAMLSDSERSVMGQSGQAYFARHFEMRHQVRELIGLLAR